MSKMRAKIITLTLTLTLVAGSLVGCNQTKDINEDLISDIKTVNEYDNTENKTEDDVKVEHTVSRDIVVGDVVIPAYDGTKASIEVNENIPFFTEDDITIEEFETYSELDELGRCGVAYANVCLNLMPTEPRGAIGQVKPSGWQTIKYDCVDGKYLYNRCHLIGFQLAGENANEKNLITGTRYLNIDGMLDYENMIAEFIRDTDLHVLYRVTPVFYEDNLVADGVLMEALSVEDNGNGIKFNVFAYNVQPGVVIDYSNGNSWLDGDTPLDIVDTKLSGYTENPDGIVYVVNTETKKFHYEDCRFAIKTSQENKESYNGTVNWLLDNGYEACKTCKPQ